MNHAAPYQCPIKFTLDLIGDKWSLLILRDILLRDKKFYQEFASAPEGISTNILADRLLKLERTGILTKTPDGNNRKRFIYRPTEKGLDLLPLLITMIQWGAKYDDINADLPDEIKKLIGRPAHSIRNIRARFQGEDRSLSGE